MNKLVKYTFLILLMILPQFLLGQSGEVEMADQFRADGKIYVVIIVASIVFAGIVAYLIYLDRKLRKMEKRLSEKKD